MKENQSEMSFSERRSLIALKNIHTLLDRGPDDYILRMALIQQEVEAWSKRAGHRDPGDSVVNDARAEFMATLSVELSRLEQSGGAEKDLGE